MHASLPSMKQTLRSCQYIARLLVLSSPIRVPMPCTMSFQTETSQSPITNPSAIKGCTRRGGIVRSLTVLRFGTQAYPRVVLLPVVSKNRRKIRRGCIYSPFYLLHNRMKLLLHNSAIQLTLVTHCHARVGSDPAM